MSDNTSPIAVILPGENKIDHYICNRCGLRMNKLYEHWNFTICLPALKQALDEARTKIKALEQRNRELEANNLF